MNTTDLANNNAQGILIRKSKASVRETMDLLARSVEERGATIYVRIDQQAEALKTGINLDPLEYLLFGNPKKGAPLMATNPLIALDLPLKIICWQDNEGTTMVAFNDQEYIARRHGFDTLSDSPLNVAPVVDKILK
jgi:uncharacterized protein (DUF302 family)